MDETQAPPGAQKPGPKLTQEQRDLVVTWVAAGLPSSLILEWAEERGWPKITKQAISGYRRRMKGELDALRERRRANILGAGLALKEERILRLIEYADSLEAIRFVPDKHGRLHNGREWRGAVGDIAAEMGDRVQRREISGPHGGPIQVVKELTDEQLASIITGDDNET